MAETPATQTASFATQADAEAYAANLRAIGCVRVRVSQHRRGTWWVYWREATRGER